jgi:uncharacterized protein YdeI (YjbR/CyaY-like superfamily)
MPDDLPELLVHNAAAWRAWLADHHADHPGVWLVLARKGATAPTTLNHAEALDEALCQGWIDGQLRKRDRLTYLQRFTPRGRRSAWSQINAGRIEQLQAEGRMRPAGLAQVERAQADGRWDAAYAGSARAQVPADLATALAANPRAQAMFDILTSQNRYAVIYRINAVKQAATRARRIRDFVDSLARGETVHPQRRRLDP